MPPLPKARSPIISEDSVPIFWPFMAAIAMGEAGLEHFSKTLKFIAEAEKIHHGLEPRFATKNSVLLELHTLRLRDFSIGSTNGLPTVIDTPYAGHTSTIADYHEGQSLVETLLANGLKQVLVTDWKNATLEMKDYDIDNYLAELNVCVDDLDGAVNLVGLCQGGWMAAMYAARFPAKVRTLVLAGAPIDTDAGNGPLKRMVKESPISFYEELVAIGGGLMRGRIMLDGWKSMHPQEQYSDKFLALYQHIDDPDYLSKIETFESWYENTIDLPGRWYLQAITQLFKENRFAKGQFVGLGQRLSLKNVTCPVYLLAGETDDITPSEQVFNAEKLLGTPKAKIEKAMAPGGHIGLFMRSRTLREYWPKIARWIAREQGAK